MGARAGVCRALMGMRHQVGYRCRGKAVAGRCGCTQSVKDKYALDRIAGAAAAWSWRCRDGAKGDRALRVQHAAQLPCPGGWESHLSAGRPSSSIFNSLAWFSRLQAVRQGGAGSAECGEDNYWVGAALRWLHTSSLPPPPRQLCPRHRPLPLAILDAVLQRGVGVGHQQRLV